jgi:hypothetical protein
VSEQNGKGLNGDSNDRFQMRGHKKVKKTVIVAEDTASAKALSMDHAWFV